MAYGPAEGLSLVDDLSKEPVLRNYHLLPAVRGDLLLKLGRGFEAKVELEKGRSNGDKSARAKPSNAFCLSHTSRSSACVRGPHRM